MLFCAVARGVHALLVQPIGRLRNVRRCISMEIERPSAKGLTMELRTMRENGDVVKAHLQARGSSDLAIVDRLGELFELRAEAGRAQDEALRKRKELSAEVGKLIKEGKTNTDDLKAEAAHWAHVAAEKEKEKSEAESQVADLLPRLPNFLDDSTPSGQSENDNIVLRTWGQIDNGLQDPKWHDDLAIGLGGYDADAASRVAGARFSVLRGQVARLERAIMCFCLDQAVSAGFIETSVPLIVSRSTLEGTGQLPKFEQDLFRLATHQVGGQDAFLIPTAEVPLTNLFSGELISAQDLPIKLCANTPCFRAEAGSYGRDVRGLIRQHQFPKVELVSIVHPEDAHATHTHMLNHVESLLQQLELPYRVVQLCAGDIGFSAASCYDLEVWLPAQQAYREISSVSLCADFQSRRMNLRFRPPLSKDEKKKKVKTIFPATLNGSGLAVGRTLVAILENYQHPDGSVRVPDALLPYMGGLTHLRPPSASCNIVEKNEQVTAAT